jgi:hypothetical protein
VGPEETGHRARLAAEGHIVDDGMAPVSLGEVLDADHAVQRAGTRRGAATADGRPSPPMVENIVDFGRYRPGSPTA